MNVLQNVSTCNKEKNESNKIECLSKFYVKCLEYVDKRNSKEITNSFCDIFVTETSKKIQK